MSRETETLLWQGRPDTRVIFDIRSPMEFAFGLSFLGGPTTPALLLYLGGSLWWLAFLPVMVVGFWMVVGWCLWDALRRRVTRYYLSSERMVIDTLWPAFPQRTEHPLTPDTEIRLEAPHLWYARRDRPTWDGQPPRNIGFEYLDDARAVADQMQRAQWARSLPPKADLRD